MNMYQYMMEIYSNKTAHKCWRYSMMIEKRKSIHYSKCNI